MHDELAAQRRAARPPGARGRPRRRCSRPRSRPARGRAASISSPASTGTCSAVMSRRSVTALPPRQSRLTGARRLGRRSSRSCWRLDQRSRLPDLDPAGAPDHGHVLGRGRRVSISGGGSMMRPAASSWPSKAPAWSRRSSRAGLGSKRVAAAERSARCSCSQPFAGQIDDTGVELLGENRLRPESAPLNLAGIVSRFFASSVYSNCPRNAKPESSPSSLALSGTWDGGVGGTPPSRSGSTWRPLYPTLSHFATHFGNFSHPGTIPRG